MSWSTNRQFKYLSIFFLVIGVILFLILFPIFYKKPNCFDGKKNNNELGIDCGGNCDLRCESTVSDPVILWSRAFNVTGGVYNLLAYVENQNKDSAVKNINYQFKIYDSNNLLIGTRRGSTFIPANQRFPIFEARFDAGQATPKSVTFEFTEPLVWFKKDPVIQTMPIKVDKIILGEDPLSPSLSARVVNDSIYNLSNFDVVAILYDVEKNAISVSKTHKEKLNSNSSVPIFFTWPHPFSTEPIFKDVILIVNPFETEF